MQKLYCYIDESGQDTKGKLFIVAVVVVQNTGTRDTVEQQLAQLEGRIKKRTDWRDTHPTIKKTYLTGVMQIPELKDNIVYGIFRRTQDYDQLTAQTLIKAVQTTTNKPVQVTVSIEGRLDETRKRRLTKALRAATVRYRTVRGQRFDSSALIRLADASAGFVSDWERGKSYVKAVLTQPRFHKVFRRLR